MSESWPGSQDEVEATIDLNVPIKMRDGLITRADVYRPRGAGRHPVILQRTPYDKGIGGFANLSMRPIRAVSRGYAVVIQDVRGRWNSEGRFDPFRQEIDDGYDTVEWCGTQPWSNGKVGMYGGSYVGATQWLAAASGAPHLKCIFPALTAANYYEEWFYRGGALQLSFVESWCVNSFCATELFRRGKKEEAERMLDVRDAMAEKVFDHIPVAKVPYFRGNAEFFYDWVSHPEQDAYWEEINLENFHSRISAPAFNLGGWYDIFLEGTISNFLRMRKHGKTKESRQQKLVIGPWMHLGRASDLGKLIGDVDFGHEAAYATTDVEGMVLDWYDSWLKGGPQAKTPPVRIFVMGENVWRDEDDWPLARTKYTDYYIHSGGSANTLDGDGSLGTVAPKDERPDRFLYDPLDPVPTAGGALCCDATFNPAGPYDQTCVEKRKDVLVYSTPPLKKPVEVTGRVVLKLFAATSAADTDFTAKLVDVWECGYAQLLAQGIIRARYRESTRRPKLIKPGRVYEYTIDLWSTSNLFLKGHQVRLEVSSSNFPHFERNMNTAKQPAMESRPVVAEQHVYHDASRPSRVILPVIPR